MSKHEFRSILSGSPAVCAWWKKRGVDPARVAVRGMGYKWPILTYEQFDLDANGHKMLGTTTGEDVTFSSTTRTRLAPIVPWFMRKVSA